MGLLRKYNATCRLQQYVGMFWMTVGLLRQTSFDIVSAGLMSHADQRDGSSADLATATSNTPVPVARTARQGTWYGIHSAEDRFQNPGLAHSVCLFILCVNYVSSFANEFSIRFFQEKAYLSTVAIVLLPIAVLATGNAFQGLRLNVGKWFTAFGFWLVLAAPFSYWRSDTLKVLTDYWLRSFIFYFAICACALTPRQLRKIMHTLGVSTLLVLLTCIAFGSTSSDGRFAVANSGFAFLANSNDLALFLLFGIVILIFQFFLHNNAIKAICLPIIAASGMYMLRTGSRGVMLSSVAVVTILLWVSHRRGKVVACTAAVVALALLALPESARTRLVDIALNHGNQAAAAGIDDSALGSQIARENILQESITTTLKHPIFGVGPGEFAAANWAARGEEGPWLGTHNSYTQVSSEAGIPALVFYVATIVLCVRMNYRVYRASAGREGLNEYAGLGLCMLLATVLYAVSTIFFHIAYSSYLPTIGGLTSATYFAARRSAVIAQ